MTTEERFGDATCGSPATGEHSDAMSALTVRQASPRDLPRLVALNAAAYPELVADGVIFDRAQLAAHQSAFPEGQIVACGENGVIGALATLRVPAAAALAPHDWIAITGHGTFSTHVPSGDALYLADIYADPSARGRGVGNALYGALFALCVRLRIDRVVAGGRLFGYHEVAGAISPEQYVREVIAGVRKDHVLTSQLRAGFELRGILAAYLDDWRSASFATHLVWTSPHVERTTRPADDPSRVDRSPLLSLGQP